MKTAVSSFLKSWTMTGPFRKWEIWLANVKFDDSDEVKQRPVVIVENNIAFILALKVTSHTPRKGFYGEYALKYWQEAGLNKESTVRISQRLKLEEHDLNRRLGRLHSSDILQIQSYL